MFELIVAEEHAIQRETMGKATAQRVRKNSENLACIVCADQRFISKIRNSVAISGVQIQISEIFILLNRRPNELLLTFQNFYFHLSTHELTLK